MNFTDIMQVHIETVTPPTATGFKRATGVNAQYALLANQYFQLSSMLPQQEIVCGCPTWFTA